MCGIFALLNQNLIYNKGIIFDSFIKSQTRGPESSIFEMDKNFILGFHRLAINGLNTISNQPIFINNCKLICNGEIYNYKELYSKYNIQNKTDSDCEIIIHLYILFGIEKTLQLLDGVFSLILIDFNFEYPEIFIARDPFGVRPLFQVSSENYMNDFKIYAFASELKNLDFINNSNLFNHNINQFPSGSFCIFKYNPKIDQFVIKQEAKKYFYLKTSIIYANIDINNIYENIYDEFLNTIKKRVIGTSDRPIACLLSGGLDSSLVSAFVKKIYNGELETYSIGLENSCDLYNAQIVSKHIKSNHTNLILTENDFFEAIPEVIKTIESYDTTSVRASVGNYLIGKYIAKYSKAKVIFNGDGADELMGGYLYLHLAPSDLEFDIECRRLLNDIKYFDVIRSDRCISSHGLEPRTPFLDKNWVNYYLNIPLKLRNHNNLKLCEKYLLRKSIEYCDKDLIPSEILWRKKEAFSDGVSSQEKSWYTIIDEKIKNLYEKDPNLKERLDKLLNYPKNLHNPPTTLEQAYYRNIFEEYYENKGEIIPYFWMPKFVEASDASARTLDIYKKV